MKAPKLSFPPNQSLLLGPNMLKDENIYVVRKSIEDPPRIFFKETNGKQEKLSLDLSKASKFDFNWATIYTPSLKREQPPSAGLCLTDLEGLTRNQRKRLRKKYKQSIKKQISPLNLNHQNVKKDLILPSLKVEPEAIELKNEKLNISKRSFHLSDSENSALEKSLSPEIKKDTIVSTSFAPVVDTSKAVINTDVFTKKNPEDLNIINENSHLASVPNFLNISSISTEKNSGIHDKNEKKSSQKLDSSPILSNISNSATRNTSINSSHCSNQQASPVVEPNSVLHDPVKDQQPSPFSDNSNNSLKSNDKPVKYLPTPICKVLPLNLPVDCYNSSALFLYDDNLVAPMNALFDPKNFNPKFSSDVSGPLYGFRNLGATCFMNASLQCLFNCPLFSNYLIDTYCESKEKIADLFPLGRLRFIAYRLIVEGKKIVPRSIEKNLTKLHPFLERGYQHDAEEFLTALLGKLVDMSAKELKETAGSNYHPCQINSDPFTQMFGITSRTTLSCPCGHKNYTQVQSLLLSLPIAPTLEESIKQLSKPEFLEDYSCPSCKKKGGVRKSDAIRVPPQILIIRLSRSCYDENGAYKDKSLVKYNSVLDLAPYLNNNSSKPLEYELRGIVLHEGSSVQSGHYIAQVLSPDNLWRQYDDDIHCKIPSPTLQSRQAYVLVYTRKEILDYKSNIPAVVIQDSNFVPRSP